MLGKNITERCLVRRKGSTLAMEWAILILRCTFTELNPYNTIQLGCFYTGIFQIGPPTAKELSRWLRMAKHLGKAFGFLPTRLFLFLLLTRVLAEVW